MIKTKIDKDENRLPYVLYQNMNYKKYIRL